MACYNSQYYTSERDPNPNPKPIFEMKELGVLAMMKATAETTPCKKKHL